MLQKSNILAQNNLARSVDRVCVRSFMRSIKPITVNHAVKLALPANDENTIQNA